MINTRPVLKACRAEIVEVNDSWIVIRFLDHEKFKPPIDIMHLRKWQVSGKCEPGGQGEARYQTDHKSGLWFFYGSEEAAV